MARPCCRSAMWRGRFIRARRSRRCRRCRWSKAARRSAIGLGDEELALACAQHGGEPAHVEVGGAHARARRARCVARSNAARIGRRMRRRRGARARPAARRRRCITIAPASTRASCASPARRARIIAATLRRRIPCSARCVPRWRISTGVRLGADVCGIDGCSVPTWACRSTALAHAFARFCNGAGASRPSARKPRPGCARPARRSHGTWPAPDASAARS